MTIGEASQRKICTFPDCTKGVKNGYTVCSEHFGKVYYATSNHQLKRNGLTDDQLNQIKRLKAALKTKHEIAVTMGLSRSTIDKVFKGTYKQKETP